MESTERCLCRTVTYACTGVLILSMAAYSANNSTLEAEPSNPQTVESTTLSSGIAGTYRVTGSNPEGSSYEGTLDITALGTAYELVWNTAELPSVGIGILDANILAVGWGDRQCGVASYQVRSDGRLEGKWIAFDQERIGQERALPSSNDSNNDIVSQYTALGENPDGSLYDEIISVQTMGDLYQFLWQGSQSIGTGLRKGNTLAVGYGLGPCNVAVYQVQEDGSLTGTWGIYNESQTGTEEAIRQ